MDNPVCSDSGMRGSENHHSSQPRSELNYYVVRARVDLSFTPSCASLARGYPHLALRATGYKKLFLVNHRNSKKELTFSGEGLKIHDFKLTLLALIQIKDYDL